MRVVHHLQHARASFEQLHAVKELKEVYELQAIVFHSLGETQQRDEAAMKFRKLTCTS